jgi:hypothetical protein
MVACRNVDKVDNVMEDARVQLELTQEINEAISNPAGMGIDVSFRLCIASFRMLIGFEAQRQVDSTELEEELAQMEQEELNKRLAGAEPAPLHAPGPTAAGALSFHVRTYVSESLTFSLRGRRQSRRRHKRSKKMQRKQNSGNYKPSSPCDLAISLPRICIAPSLPRRIRHPPFSDLYQHRLVNFLFPFGLMGSLSLMYL